MTRTSSSPACRPGSRTTTSRRRRTGSSGKSGPAGSGRCTEASSPTGARWP
uniref:Uncharacterized protein n=1 Tax=Arundo donax TaxID=35708 RepID=A0A0A9AA88_ARUDO